METQRRTRPRKLLRRLGLILVLLALAGMRAPTYEIGRQVVSSGAADMAGGNFQTRGTVGQSAGGFASGGEYQHGTGFWHTAGDPTATSVPEVPGRPLLETRLDQNIPNPFNPRTTIRFALAKAGHVQMRLFDLRGRLVMELLNRPMDAGEHDYVFDGTQLPSGVYVYQLRSEGFSESRRFTLVK